MWAEGREEVPPNVKRMVCSKKTMLSTYFSRTGFVSIKLLPQGQNYNSYFVTEIILPSIVENLSVAGPKLKETAAHLHTDNAKSHNSQLSLQKIEEYGFIRVPQPPYSPDLALCDHRAVRESKRCPNKLNKQRVGETISERERCADIC
jgi:hypothetical protein